MRWLGGFRVGQRLAEVDRKLQTDDEIVKRLSDVVLQLRVVTKQTELILRELQEDERWMDDE